MEFVKNLDDQGSIAVPFINGEACTITANRPFEMRFEDGNAVLTLLPYCAVCGERDKLKLKKVKGSSVCTDCLEEANSDD